MAFTESDLLSYISQYSGYTKVRRLVFIAENCPVEMRAEAVRLAIEEIKRGINTTLYRDVAEKLGKEYVHDSR